MATITGTFNSLVSGTISGVFNNTAGGVLSGIVGTPGPRGLTGSQGPQGPAGPAPIWGNITGTLSAQTDLSTVLAGKYSTSNPAGYIDLTTAGLYFYPLTGNPGGFATQAWVIGQNYLTASSLDSYATQSWVNYQLAGYALQSWVTDQGYITASALSPYLLSSTAASTYAVIAAGQPTSGTVGQVLTKNSGTNYDSSWQTLIPGDRYLTTSSTSNAVSNGAKTFTVSTGLSYTTQQDVTIAYDATHHMHAVVTSYDSVTGVLVVDVQQHTGTGTFTSWTVNVGGTVPLQSVAWGDITGTLGSQSDLATALNNKLEVTTAASTYYLQTNPSGFITSSALTGYATESWVNSQGFATLTTTQKDAVTTAEIKNYEGGAIGDLSWSSNTIKFTDLSRPNPDGGQVSFSSDSVYSYYHTGNNWNIHYPYGTGQTVSDLVAWINANCGNAIGLNAEVTSGDGTASIDGIDMTSSNQLFYVIHTLSAGDTFLIQNYFRDYLTKFYRDTVSSTYTLPYLVYNTSTNQVDWSDISGLGFVSSTNPNIYARLNAYAGLTVSGANLQASSGAALSGTVTLGSNATATTPVSTDSSTLVATTAFVKSYKPTGSFLGTRYFTTVGSSAYTPTTGTNFVVVEVIGGGGGSNGFDSTSAAYHTGGGGAGGYGKKKITTGFSGVTITVGAAGTAGASGTLTGAGNGGTSSFGSALSCTGGTAGGATSVITVGASTGGAAGAATGSDFAYTSAAGSTSGTNAYASGKGGDAAMGYGQAGFPGVASSASTQIIIAQASYGYGSGASGHARGAAAASAIGGTAGRQGLVIVHEYT